MFRRETEQTPEQALGKHTELCLSAASVRRDDRLILDALTLTLDEARIGIVGRNGSGKSTLARLVAGLIAPDSGEVRLGDIDPARDRKAALSRVGIIFQNPDHQIIFPTVAEELAFGLTQMGTPRDEAGQRVEAVLARFGRSHWAPRAVHTLSQGQRHFLCLLSVIVMAPGLIVLDEPFAGLDIPTCMALNRVLGDLPQRLLHITHDPDSLSDYDRVIWLDQGRIRDDGPARDVLAAYKEEMTRIGASDDLSDLAG